MKTSGSGQSRFPSYRFPSSAWPLVALIAAMFAPIGVSFALPTGGQVVAGSAAVTRPSAQSLTVQQSSPRAIINWQSFSIAAPESVSFQQPSPSSVVLNRVIGTSASEIAGRMTSNGQVFLVNPNGVLFAKGAVVDVGGLVASALDISNHDFLAGNYRFSGTGGAVTNSGSLHASEGGTVALLGGQVQNDGTITAKLGTVALAAGNRVTLDFAGDGLTKVTVNEGALAAEIQNRGAVIADGGQAILTARAAEALTQTVVNQSGLVQARTLTERPGKILLDGGDTGQTLASGTLDASGREPGQKGGEVQVLGHHVGVTGTALLDASGDAGGGSVLVGGDYQGKNAAVRNAAATWFGPAATIHADALGKGDGGKVIVWSDEATRAYGTISARGGAKSGDGGVIETSGKWLDVAGLRIDASASNGKGGEWLLDPVDLLVINGGGQGITRNVDASGGPPSNTFESRLGVTAGPTLFSVVGSDDIKAALESSTNVTLLTGGANDPQAPGDGNIHVDANITKDAGGPSTLTFRAHNAILVTPRSSIASTSGALNLILNADSDGNGQGAVHIGGTVPCLPACAVGSSPSISTNGGSVLISGGIDPTTGRAVAAGYTLTLPSLSPGVGPVVVPVSDPRSVVLENASLNTGGGSVEIRGGGPTGIAGSSGVSIVGSTTINAGAGNISIDGIGTAGAPGATLKAAGAPGGPGVQVIGSSLQTTSGNINITGFGGAGGAGAVAVAAGSPGQVGPPGGLGGRGVDVTGSSLQPALQTASGNMNITGVGGAGGTGGAGTLISTFAVASGSGGAGGPGVSLSLAPGPTIQTIQTNSGSIAIESFGGNGGAGGFDPGGAAGGSGGAGGAGLASTGASILTGGGPAEFRGSGGAGGAGGNCDTGICGSGGGGGAGVLQNWRVEARGGSVLVLGSGGNGGQGGAGAAGSSGGQGGGGGDGITTSDGASIIGTTGSVTLSGIGGVGGPASLVAAETRPSSEGSSGTGVTLFGIGSFPENPTVETTSGDIFITGLASSPFEERGATGLVLFDVVIETTAGGNIDIRGRGEATAAAFSRGVEIDSPSTIRTQGAPGTMIISGQSTGTDLGVAFGQSEGGGINLVGGQTTSGNIVIRASNAGGGDSIDLGGTATKIQTTGVINLRPGGVSAEGALAPADGETIEIATEPVPPPELGTFRLSPADLGTLAAGAQAIVIGGTTHTGLISVLTPYTFKDNVTLQNAGAGSQGIALEAALSSPGNSITLSSAGPVTQLPAAPITAAALLLQGTGPDSNFVLTNTPNVVARFAADSPLHGGVQFANGRALSIEPLSGTGIDAATNVPTKITAPNTVSFSDLFVQAAGDLALHHNISTVGSDITLVTAGVFENAGNGQLLPGGNGRWTVWASTWDGEARGGLVPTSQPPTIPPNNYGCTFPGTCASGATVPTTGNHFVYQARPTLIITTPDQQRTYGDPNPPFPITTIGLLTQLGDTQADAVSGSFFASTTAAVNSNVGPHLITVTPAGPVTSPAGYILEPLDGTLTITKANLTYAANQTSREVFLPNPPLTGIVVGFRNGDQTKAGATTGTPVFTSPATPLTPPGAYPIFGSGLDAINYNFIQAASNATALTVFVGQVISDPPPVLCRTPGMCDSNVYASGFLLPNMCVAGGPLITTSGLAAAGDILEIEWTRVRLRPNLTNCVSVGDKDYCHDF